MSYRDRDFAHNVLYSRQQCVRIINDIRNGEVNEEDIDKLSNFLQFALALMQAEGSKRWSEAKRNAELMSYMK